MLLLALLACKGDTVADSRGEHEGGPALQLSPTALDFGEVPAYGAAAEVVTMQNVGDEDLHVFSLSLSEPADDFVVSAVESVLVPPGQASTFIVSFAPEAQGPRAAHLSLETDAINQPVTELPLSGVGVAPEALLLVEPANLTLTEVLIGCSEAQTLTLTNPHRDAIQLEDVLVLASSDEWTVDLMLDERGPLPWAIEAGASLEVEVRYTPVDETPDTQVLRFTSGERQAADTQTGIGATIGARTDRFEVGRADAVDVLIALNTRPSMQDDMENVVQNLETLVSTIDDWRADTHVALVTASDGCVAGDTPYLRNITSDQVRLDALAGMLDGASGGQDADAPFTLMQSALSEENLGPGGCNEGFLRDDASLALLSISDQAESSVNSYAYYVALFQSMKWDPSWVKMNAIAGDYPRGCATADPGQGFYEAALATDGFMTSICPETFGMQLYRLEEVGDYSDGIFPLSGVPVESTITVTYRGSVMTEGWRYEPARGRLVFATTPLDGEEVTIEYLLQPECGA